MSGVTVVKCCGGAEMGERRELKVAPLSTSVEQTTSQNVKVGTGLILAPVFVQALVDLPSLSITQW